MDQQEISNFRLQFGDDDAFQREISYIMKEVCLYFSLPSNLSDEEIDQQIIVQSRRYLAGPKELSCEAVVADNLFFRRRLIGCSPEQIAQAMGLSVDIILDYEMGLRSIDKNREEFIRLASVYQYHIINLRKIFLYGSAFHEMFDGLNFWPPQSALHMCRNPFFQV